MAVTSVSLLQYPTSVTINSDTDDGILTNKAYVDGNFLPNNEVISVDLLPKASASQYGVVQVDGTTIKVTNNLLSVPIDGTTLQVTNNGTISLRLPEYARTTTDHISYKVGDIVVSNGMLWKCTKNTTSASAFDSANWSMIITRKAGYYTGTNPSGTTPQDGICSFSGEQFDVNGGGGVTLRRDVLRYMFCRNDDNAEQDNTARIPTSFQTGDVVLYENIPYTYVNDTELTLKGLYNSGSTARYNVGEAVYFRGRYFKKVVETPDSNPWPVTSSTPWRINSQDNSWENISPGYDDGTYWRRGEVNTTYQTMLRLSWTNSNPLNLVWDGKHWIIDVSSSGTTRTINLPTMKNSSDATILNRSSVVTAEMILRCVRNYQLNFKCDGNDVAFLGDYPEQFESGYTYFIVFRNFPADSNNTRLWVGNIQGQVAIPST